MARLLARSRFCARVYFAGIARIRDYSQSDVRQFFVPFVSLQLTYVLLDRLMGEIFPELKEVLFVVCCCCCYVFIIETLHGCSVTRSWVYPRFRNNRFLNDRRFALLSVLPLTLGFRYLVE